MPTLREIPPHALWAVCNNHSCSHGALVDIPSLIALGHGDTEITRLRFRCGSCGGTDVGVRVSGEPARGYVLPVGS